MRLAHVQQLAVFHAPTPERRRRVGRLALRGRELLFEYDPTFLGSRLELSPFRLPLQRGVTVGQPAFFEGLMGVFDDSLPDGWGRLLLDRRAVELGLSVASLTRLDRLAVVGARAMGALVYEPEVVLDEPTVVELAELARDARAVVEMSGRPTSSA